MKFHDQNDSLQFLSPIWMQFAPLFMAAWFGYRISIQWKPPPPILATNFSCVISSPYYFHFTERDRRVRTITFFSGGSRGQISASRRDIRTAVFAAFHNSRMLPQISTRLFLFHSFPFNYSPIALPFGVTCFEVLTYIDKLNSFPCRSKYVFQNCSQTSWIIVILLKLGTKIHPQQNFLNVQTNVAGFRSAFGYM